jgi:pimeloyl-ACP methyl ester carboxylesterase
MKISKSYLPFILALLFATAVSGQSPQEKSVEVFGFKINYLEAGSPEKPAVILLHGLGSSYQAWQFNVAALAGDYHVIAPDQIGFGRSDKPLLKYTVSTYVDFLDKFMSELKIEKATLIGNSMGGWISALTAIKYPQRVERLILVDAAGIKSANIDPKLIWKLNFSSRDEVREMLKLSFYNQALFASDAAIDEALKRGLTSGDGYTVSSLIESIIRDDGDFLNTRLGAIKQPTLIIWGKYDRLVPLSDAETFKAAIAGSRLVVIDKAAHLPQIEAAQEFNKTVLEFLKGN